MKVFISIMTFQCSGQFVLVKGCLRTRLSQSILCHTKNSIIKYPAIKDNYF